MVDPSHFLTYPALSHLGRPVAGRVDLGECTASTGILSNYEIDRIITERYKPNVVYNETALTTNMHHTVNGRPETAAFDAVLSRSLTVLASRVPKPMAGPVYCHPCFVLVVPGAWTHRSTDIHSCRSRRTAVSSGANGSQAGASTAGYLL